MDEEPRRRRNTQNTEAQKQPPGELNRDKMLKTDQDNVHAEVRIGVPVGAIILAEMKCGVLKMS